MLIYFKFPKVLPWYCLPFSSYSTNVLSFIISRVSSYCLFFIFFSLQDFYLSDISSVSRFDLSFWFKRFSPNFWWSWLSLHIYMNHQKPSRDDWDLLRDGLCYRVMGCQWSSQILALFSEVVQVFFCLKNMQDESFALSLWIWVGERG